MRNIFSGLTVVGLLVYGGVVFASDPALTCEASKLKTVSKYDSCRFRAYSNSVRAEATPDFSRCSLLRFDDAEARANGLCATTGDQADIVGFVDFCTDSVALALAGGALPVDCLTCGEDLLNCASNLSSTNADLGTCNDTLASCGGNLTSCNGSLSTCQSSLSSTNADLGICNGSLATCNTNLSTANASLATCQSSLGTATSGTATVGQVLAGRTFTSSAGTGVTGTMPNNGAISVIPGSASQTIAAGYHNGSGSVAGDADLVAGNIKSGVNLFGVTGTATSPGVGLQKTGQTTCYNAIGSTVACPGTGQDGEFQRGLTASFTDNGDGTITDNLTSLMWEKLSDDDSIHDKNSTYTWTDSFAGKVGTLNSTVFAGYSDWRVPNVRELQTLQNYGAWNPATYSAFNNACTSGCSVTTCSCTWPGYYWSSSTDQDGTHGAWIVDFFRSFTGFDLKVADYYYVRAVRSGP